MPPVRLRGTIEAVDGSSRRQTPEASRITEGKKLANTKARIPSPQEASVEPPPNGGGAQTTNLLVEAVPTVPAGAFENRFGAWH